MFIDIIIFAVMAKFYKYVDEGEITEETIQMSQETGAFNASYHQDEK